MFKISLKYVFIFFILGASRVTVFGQPAVTSQTETTLQEIVVKEGDTLWGLANHYLQDPKSWPDILKYNHLPTDDPNTILSGMKLKVPVLLIKENLRAAYLISLLNDVRYRRKTETAWSKAVLNMELYNEDSLKTGIKSIAQVRFYTGEILRISDNSLVVLRPEAKREEVELLSGEIRTSRAKVITASAVIEPKIAAKSVNPDYRTKIKEDKTTLVAVYKGEIDVTAQGKTVTLSEGFGSEIKYLQPPSLPIALPPFPTTKITLSNEDTRLPEPVSVSTAPVMLPKISDLRVQLPSTTQLSYNLPSTPGANTMQAKAISKPVTMAEYHLQIAYDQEFKRMVLNETDKIDKTVDLKRNLSDGTYYWRIAYVDALGFESDYSLPQCFMIDTQPPKIEVVEPKSGDTISNEFVLVKGKTEPKINLEIDNKPILVNDKGEFMTSLLLKPGKYTIVAAAKDLAGNTTIVKTDIIKSVNTIKTDLVNNTAAHNVSSSTVTSRIVSETPKKGADKKPPSSLSSIILSTITATIILYVIFAVII